MHATRQFTRKCLVDHAVALDPALTAERFRHDMNPEMGLAARPVAGMALVLMRFINHVQALRRERGAQFFGDEGLHFHETLGKAAPGEGQPVRRKTPSWKNHLSRLEGGVANSA
jgi:hypothetical protein